MNIIDENIVNSQRKQLLEWNIRVRQIGFEIGRKGLKDINEIIPLLHSIKNPTFFTRDHDLYHKKLRHSGYSLVYLNVHEEQVANIIQRFLRHPEFNTQAKRMGCVIRISQSSIHYWQLHTDEEQVLNWKL